MTEAEARVVHEFVKGNPETMSFNADENGWSVNMLVDMGGQKVWWTMHPQMVFDQLWELYGDKNG